MFFSFGTGLFNIQEKIMAGLDLEPVENVGKADAFIQITVLWGCSLGGTPDFSPSIAYSRFDS